MKSAPYFAIVSPKLLDLLSFISPLKSIGNHTLMLGVPMVLSREVLSPNDERHEAIHVWQMLECSALVLGAAALIAPISPAVALIVAGLALVYGGPLFWAVYLGTYVKGLLTGAGGVRAYLDVPLEVEAYKHGADPEYIKTRPWFAWI
jgi:hypothetical protein